MLTEYIQHANKDFIQSNVATKMKRTYSVYTCEDSCYSQAAITNH